MKRHMRGLTDLQYVFWSLLIDVKEQERGHYGLLGYVKVFKNSIFIQEHNELSWDVTFQIYFRLRTVQQCRLHPLLDYWKSSDLFTSLFMTGPEPYPKAKHYPEKVDQ